MLFRTNTVKYHYLEVTKWKYIPQRLQRFLKSNFYRPKQSISGRISKVSRSLKRDKKFQQTIFLASFAHAEKFDDENKSIQTLTWDVDTAAAVVAGNSEQTPMWEYRGVVVRTPGTYMPLDKAFYSQLSLSTQV